MRQKTLQSKAEVTLHDAIQRSINYARQQRNRGDQDLPEHYQPYGGQLCKGQKLLLRDFGRICRLTGVVFVRLFLESGCSLPRHYLRHVVHGRQISAVGANVSRRSQPHCQRLPAEFGQLDVEAEKRGCKVHVETYVPELLDRDLSHLGFVYWVTCLRVGKPPRSICQYCYPHHCRSSNTALIHILVRQLNRDRDIDTDQHRTCRLNRLAFSCRRGG